jgi:hypothetical protein
MMCQSLDNDEVVNVRWATEDPNPTSKVAEKARLEDLGEKGIARNLPAHLIRAVREMDELEGVVDAREEAFSDDEDEARAIEPPEKRLRIEEAPPKTGLLGSMALADLKRAAALVKRGPAPAAKVGLGALGDYGSDSD